MLHDVVQPGSSSEPSSPGRSSAPSEATLKVSRAARRSTPVRVLLVAAAGAAALAPFPAAWVERLYSQLLYPPVQRWTTTLSNVVPWAVFDLVVAVVLVALAVRLTGVAGTTRSVARTGAALLLEIGSAAALGYLLFLAAWGFNYRRQPLREKLSFDPARVEEAALAELAAHAAARLNELYGPSHEGEWPEARQLPQAFRPAFEAAVDRLPGARRMVAGVPKRSLLSWYFERAAIDGMTNPFGLEVILHPRLLPFERHFVVAHEWAHLAGYASEEEASFVGWLACFEGDAQARYSGWLTVYLHSAGALPRGARGELARALDPRVREDLRAIDVRLRRASPVVRRAAWRAYDGYLRANRVASGVRSYEEAITLALGTRTGPVSIW